MHKLTFTLKQHTPLIHFQSVQKGATLRASEVKPKLDKFIIEKLGGLNRVKKDHPKWLIGKGEYPALDYKIKINAINSMPIEIAPPIFDNGEISISSQGKIITKTWPLYFGNKGKERTEIYEIKSGVKAKISLLIMSFSSDLIQYISDNQIISHFFFVENFGTRQSKGYGCFYLVDEDDNNLQVHFPVNIKPINFSIDLEQLEIHLDKTITGSPNKRPNDTDDYRLFKALEIFYQFLRNGINYSVDGQKLYVKPAIFQYALSQSQQWDKKSIKQKFFNSIRQKQAIIYNESDVLTYKRVTKPEDYIDFKDLLGFSSEEEWGLTGIPDVSYGHKIKKSFTVKYTDSEGQNQSQDECTRFKSPLRFHIMQQAQGSRKFDIWFWLNDVPVEYLNAETTVKLGDTNRQMKLSMYNLFNSSDFLQLIFGRKDINALDAFSTTETNTEAPHYKVLYSICDSIKNSLL